MKRRDWSEALNNPPTRQHDEADLLIAMADHLDADRAGAGHPWTTIAAWATDRDEPIVRVMLDQLRRTNIMLPAPHVLERIGLEARVRAGEPSMLSRLA